MNKLNDTKQTKPQKEFYICNSKYIKKDGTVKIYRQIKTYNYIPSDRKAKRRMTTIKKRDIKTMVSSCKDSDIIEAIYDSVQKLLKSSKQM